MNENTKHFLKMGCLLLTSAVIGGFIGGWMGSCCHHCKCMRHMYMHHGTPGAFAPHFHHGQRPSQFEGRFIEEDFIVVPNNAPEAAGKNPKQFEGKKPEKMNPADKKSEPFEGPMPIQKKSN